MLQPAQEATAPSVLVVDDDPALCQMVERALGRAGYQSQHATSGAEGLRWLEDPRTDLVLLDLGLPDVSGLELCRQIRRQARDVYLPIIILTGANDPERRHQGFTAGADDYITKPFAIADLLDRVRAWAGARQRLQAAHAQALLEQERSRQLDAQLAQDEAVLAMARTTSHELNQPLTVLTTLIHLQKAGAYGVEETEQVWAALDDAVQDLTRRVRELGRVVRYEPREEAGFRLIDLPHGQPREP